MNSLRYRGRDLGWLLDLQADHRGQRPFLTWEPFDGPQRTWTYAQFAAEARAVAAGLRFRGLGPGDRLLVHLDNGPEFLLVWFACALSGVVAVTTNTRASLDELRYFAGHARTRAAVCGAEYAGLIAQAAPAHEWMVVVGSSAADPVSPDFGFATLVAEGKADLPIPRDPSRWLSIQYTSGTTARPKGVVWTHANALWAAQVSAMHQDLRSDDVHLAFLPLFHTNALSYSMLASLWVGAHIVLQPRFSASRFWSVALRNRCTWASMIPFVRRALAEQPVPQHQFRLWGTAVCEPPDDVRFGVKTIGWWGMTETLTHGVVGSVHHPNTSMSMGRASPAYDVSVTDDEGRLVGPGETGELRIGGERGVSLFAEYLDDPTATEAAFDDRGRLRTGDTVRIANDGALFFSGRSKDMLKVGGENVAASEIERVILAVPGVVEAAVVGKSDPMLSEVPVAFVIAVTGSDVDRLRDAVNLACRTGLADFKVPHHVFFVEDLPRATLNKVSKPELRRRLLNLESTPHGPEAR